MEIKGRICYRKGIIIDKNRIEEIITLMQMYCDRIEYSADLENETNVVFECYEELLEYENYNKKKIKELNLRGYKNEYRSNIDLRIGERFRFIFKYADSVICYYTFDSQDNEAQFQEKFTHIFNKSKSSFWILSKVSLWGFFWTAYTFYYLIILMPNAFAHGIDWSGELVVLGLVAMGVIGTAIMILWQIESRIWNKIFPGVVFKIGEEIAVFEKMSKYRSGILWTVVVGTIVSIMATVLVDMF